MQTSCLKALAVLSILMAVAAAPAQTAPFHLHNEASTINTSFKTLLTVSVTESLVFDAAFTISGSSLLMSECRISFCCAQSESLVVQDCPLGVSEGVAAEIRDANRLPCKVQMTRLSKNQRVKSLQVSTLA